MASVNRFRGTPRATAGDQIQWVASFSNVAPDPDTDVGPTATLPTPVGLNVGDLVVVACYYRGATQNWSVSTSGGQNWIPCATHRSTTQMVQAFFCRFNGTWAAAPVFTIGSGTETAIAVLHAFRGVGGEESQWALDQSPLLGSAAGTAFAITGATPQSARTLAIALVASQDDNEYTLTTPGRWSVLGNKQYRSTGGTDGAMAFAQLAQNQATATGNLTLTQATLGADAGITMVLVFKEGLDASQGRAQVSTAPRAFGFGRRMFKARPGAYTEVAAGGFDTIELAGIPTGELFGPMAFTAGDVSATLAGIPTSERLGALALDSVYTATLAGIRSAEALGALQASAGPVTITLAGVPTGERFGSLTLAGDAITITLAGIRTGEALGSLAFADGGASIGLAGIPSAERLGAPTATAGSVSIELAGIGTAERLGALQAIAGAVSINLAGIGSGERLGELLFADGGAGIQLAGIGSLERLGALTLTGGAATVQLAGILSGERLGAVALGGDPVTITLAGIRSGEGVGAVSLVPGVVSITLAGVPTMERFGALTVAAGPVTATLAGILTSEKLGALQFIAVGATTPGRILLADYLVTSMTVESMTVTSMALDHPNVTDSTASDAAVNSSTVSDSGVSGLTLSDE